MILQTEHGTQYLRAPRVIELAHTVTNVDHKALVEFINDLGMDGPEYMADFYEMPSSERVLKVAGQLCYLSFGDGHTPHTKVGGYLDNLKKMGDGSVFEHSSATFLLYGVSRSFTHELVRHRVGTGYSQSSQRYTGPEVLRFVERPEYQQSTALHTEFCAWIDDVRAQYVKRIGLLYEEMYGGQDYPLVTREVMRDRRKNVQGAARGALPNETEAPIVVTANFRTWRHILEMRTNRLAEREIRILGDLVFPKLATMAPHVFNDYTPVGLEDHTIEYSTPWRKV